MIKALVVTSFASLFVLLPTTHSRVDGGGHTIKSVKPQKTLQEPVLSPQERVETIDPSPPSPALTTVIAPANTDAKAYALAQVGASQFSCLNSLWTKESGWRVDAYNPSGAYGIPQSLPGSKMASAGADWQTNPITQVNWGISYIQATYQNPCNAWAHSQAVNWY